MKKIQIKCSGLTTLPIDLILEFQGALKKLSKANLDKLKKNILKLGFIAPLFVWDNKGDNLLLDGHQRLAALIGLRQDGYDIPLLPVDYIHAEDEAEAKKMLLAITSQFGEFDQTELQEWIDQLDDGTAELLRLVDHEIVFDEPESITEASRGGAYNDERSPDVDGYKLAYRIEAISRAIKTKCIELYAGRGILTYWYNRQFETVVTNDYQRFDNIKHDYNLKAIDFIKTKLMEHLDFNYIDFDDEGCPAKEIQEFFRVIKDVKKDKFIIAITDGQGLNLRFLGKINFNETYMIRNNKMVQATEDDYYNFPNIFKSFIDKVTNTNGFSYKELGFSRKKSGGVIYGVYEIIKIDQL